MLLLYQVGLTVKKIRSSLTVKSVLKSPHLYSIILQFRIYFKHTHTPVDSNSTNDLQWKKWVLEKKGGGADKRLHTEAGTWPVYSFESSCYLLQDLFCSVLYCVDFIIKIHFRLLLFGYKIPCSISYSLISNMFF